MFFLFCYFIQTGKTQKLLEKLCIYTSQITQSAGKRTAGHTRGFTNGSGGSRQTEIHTVGEPQWKTTCGLAAPSRLLSPRLNVKLSEVSPGETNSARLTRERARAPISPKPANLGCWTKRASEAGCAPDIKRLSCQPSETEQKKKKLSIRRSLRAHLAGNSEIFWRAES